MKVVIDHVSGSRRGQRQELPAAGRVRFGRHPDCEVSFDAHRDIDASSRHAELRPPGDGTDAAGAWLLVDVGSSNGTFVDGRRVTEAPVAVGTPVTVAFGPGGPTLRVFIGDDAQIAQLEEAPAPAPRPRRSLAVAVVAAVIVAAAIVAVLLVT